MLSITQTGCSDILPDRKFSCKNVRGPWGVALAALLCLPLLSGLPSDAAADSDLPEIKFSRSSFSMNEGETAEVKVLKDGAGEASVEYATEDLPDNNKPATGGEDYTPVSGTLNFADGDTEKTISVSSLTDSESESSEVFAIRLTLPAGEAQAELDSPFWAAIVILNTNAAAP